MYDTRKYLMEVKKNMYCLKASTPDGSKETARGVVRTGLIPMHVV